MGEVVTFGKPLERCPHCGHALPVTHEWVIGVCLYPDHRHKSLETAEACRRRYPNGPHPPRWRVSADSSEPSKEAFALFELRRTTDATFKIIGDHFGISRERARQIYKKLERREKRLSDRAVINRGQARG